MSRRIENPKWIETLKKDPGLMERAFRSPELQKLISKAQSEYTPWENFKHLSIPEGFTHEEAWAILKISRGTQYKKTKVKSNNGGYFRFVMTSSLYQNLNFIDTHAAGFIKTFSEAKPSEAEKNKFIISGLAEEAIATSQIEGASTSRKVAKEMLASQRKPRTKSEQMIINSYQVMQRLDNLKKMNLSPEILLEIQSTITKNTINKEDQGRWRTDDDKIVVQDHITNEVAHTPPREEVMYEELSRFIKFANQEDGDDFTHPVIKAAILHFWLAYIHPFPDGNGRTARAIFYWYLLKKDYWLVQYLAISRKIVESRVQYDKAFIYSEEDEDDLTYFILYITNVFKKAITSFIGYFEKTTEETKLMKQVASRLDDFNSRQAALLESFLNHPNYTTEVKIHQTKHGISRQTAQNDLLDLVRKGFLVQTFKSRKSVFMPNGLIIRRLFKEL